MSTVRQISENLMREQDRGAVIPMIHYHVHAGMREDVLPSENVVDMTLEDEVGCDMSKVVTGTRGRLYQNLVLTPNYTSAPRESQTSLVATYAGPWPTQWTYDYNAFFINKQGFPVDKVRCLKFVSGGHLMGQVFPRDLIDDAKNDRWVCKFFKSSVAMVHTAVYHEVGIVVYFDPSAVTPDQARLVQVRRCIMDAPLTRDYADSELEVEFTDRTGLGKLIQKGGLLMYVGPYAPGPRAAKDREAVQRSIWVERDRLQGDAVYYRVDKSGARLSETPFVIPQTVEELLAMA